VRQLVIKVLNIIDARCKHEVHSSVFQSKDACHESHKYYRQFLYTTYLKKRNVHYLKKHRN